MGICNSRYNKNSSNKLRFHSLQMQSSYQRLNSNVIAELKRGMTIDLRKYDALKSRQLTYQRSPDDIDCPNAEISKSKKTKTEKREISAFLLNHFLFRGFSDDILNELIDNMLSFTLEKSDIVFNQNDPGYNFFLISIGSVDILINSTKVKSLERGQAFGELALLYNAPRKAQVITATRTRLWGLSRDSFRRVITVGNQRCYLENKNFLKSTPVFSRLPEAQIEALLENLTIQTFNSGEKIITAGEETPEIYVIKEGVVNVYQKNEHITYLNKGEYFGEQALLYNKRRGASVKAVCKTVLLSFSQETLVRSLGEKLEMVLYINTIRIALSSDKVLCKLTKSQINRIIAKIEIREISNNCVRSPSEELWVVIKGCVTENNTIWSLYSCINAQALISKNFTEPTVVETEYAIIAVISIDDIESVLKCSLSTRFYYNEILNSLKHTSILKLVPELELEKLSADVKLEIFKKDQEIFSEGDEGNKFYIMKSGVVCISKKGGAITRVHKGEFFGERALIFNEKRIATALAEEESEVWTIKQENFMSILNDNLKEMLVRKSFLQDTRVQIEELKCIDHIKKGTYANVYHMQDPVRGLEFALKSISKDSVFKYNLLSKYVHEKNIHLALDFPLIAHLVKTSKNSDNLFFLYEFVPGPSLSSLLIKGKPLPAKQANFYSAVIIVILNFIHGKGIIHRDITAENFIIDKLGYPMLTHFTLSKIINGRTYSIVGEAHYMSPEMIKAEGYTFYSDIWSFGIIVYQLLYGFLPFGEAEEDPFVIYKAIMEQPLRYPVFVKNSMKVKLVEQLLQKNPGARGTAEHIMKNEWFEGMPWDSLYCKQFSPGYNFEGNIFQNGMSKTFFESLDLRDSECDWADEF